MAAIKRLSALQTCRSLWVSPPCPLQGVPSPRGLWQEEASAQSPSRAPCSPAGSLQPPSPLPPLWWGSGSLCPLPSHCSPARTLLFAGLCRAGVGYRGHRGPGLTSTTVSVTVRSEMQNCQGVQEQEAAGKWKCSAFNGEGTGSHP